MPLGLLARALLAAAALVAAPQPAAASALLSEPYLLSRFSAGTSLFAPPGVAADGGLFVGTGDGYVHALGPDGRYRWSVTVQGRVVAAPVEEGATGRVFVVTSEARLYALERDSRLRWVSVLPAAPKSEVVLSSRGTLYFVGQDEHLYGVTTGGALVLRLSAASARSAPALLEGGRVAVVLGDALAKLKGYGWERRPLGRGFDQAEKIAISPRETLLACHEQQALVQSPSGVLGAPSECLWPPVAGDGFYAAAGANGSVRLYHRDRKTTEVPLGATPLRPVWDAARQRLVLSTVTGAVRVFALAREPGAQ